MELSDYLSNYHKNILLIVINVLQRRRDEERTTEQVANKNYSDAVELILQRSATDILLKVLPRGPREVKLFVFLQETSELFKECHRGRRRGKAVLFMRSYLSVTTSRPSVHNFIFSSKSVLISAFRSHHNREFALFIIYIIPRCSSQSKF